MIEFRHLKHFSVLAKERNYQKAARILNLAQPSLTRSIQRLESLLGTELLIRGHQTMSLTATGELVLSHSEGIIGGVDVLRKELQYLQGKSSGHLAIGSSPVPANTILGPSVGRFIEQYPDVHLELEVGTWQNNLRKLLQGKLDVIVTDVKGEELGYEALVQSFNLPSYNAVFCARKDHPLAEKEQLTLADIRHFPIAIPRNLPPKVMDKFDDLLFQYRSDFAGLLHYDSFPTVKGALLNSSMVALTPQVGLLNEDHQEILHIFKPVDMPKLDVCFSIVMLRKQVTLAASRFLELILSNAGEPRSLK